MGYRAHITVIRPATQRERELALKRGTALVARKVLGLAKLRETFPAVAPNERFVREPAGTLKGTLIGTRYGAPGIWLERDSIDAFKAGLRLIVGATRAAGYEPQVWATNAPSKVAADTTLYGMKVLVARG